MANHTNPLRVSPPTKDSRTLPAAMTATLSAELDGKVAHELVADIVRAVLDEGRQDVQDLAGESAMVEARRRLELFIRARSSK